MPSLSWMRTSCRRVRPPSKSLALKSDVLLSVVDSVADPEPFPNVQPEDSDVSSKLHPNPSAASGAAETHEDICEYILLSTSGEY